MKLREWIQNNSNNQNECDFSWCKLSYLMDYTQRVETWTGWIKKGLWCYKLALMWVSLYEYATGHTRATDAILDENSWYVEKWLCVSANFVNVAITMDD